MICPATGLSLRREAQGAARRAVIPNIGAVQARAPVPRKKEQRPLVEKLIGGRYRVHGLIGEGGMGAVYEAEDGRSGDRVAVKVLHPEHVAKKDAESRLRHEARVVSSLGHPNICAIYDVGVLDDGSPYLVMERLRGSSLAAWIERQGALDQSVLIDIMTQVLSALAMAHDRGVVHRDLKPDNIFLVTSPRGVAQAKLLDFGISKASGIEDTAVDLTRTGMVMGTPYYMAPEQARGDRDLDHRVDLWAVGVILYEALTGRRPFVARNYNALLVQILTAKPRPIRELNPAVTEPLAGVVARALSKLREDRQQSSRELEQAIRACRPVPKADLPRLEPSPAAAPAATPKVGRRRFTERMDAAEAKAATLPARSQEQPGSRGTEAGPGQALARPREVPRPGSRRSSAPPRRLRSSPPPATGATPRRRSSVPPASEESSAGDTISEDPTVVMSSKTLELHDYFTQSDGPEGDEDAERTVVDPPSFTAETPTLDGDDRRK